MQDSQNLGENQAQFAESAPFCHIERSEISQNKNNRDSSLRKCSAQNDKSARVAESRLDSANFMLDSAHPTQEANSSIFDESQRVASEAKQKKTPNLQIKV